MKRKQVSIQMKSELWGHPTQYVYKREPFHITHFPSTSLILFNLIGLIFSHHSPTLILTLKHKILTFDPKKILKRVSDVEGK
uniref:AlNc14C107G6271 protein n=1 Tax=Albugo laibachii Nc14 TaxID=890382 RepID=F0WI64_9STRA|nr:AlNc14C107G6271 [Albugo laibachii Nc14]|eukprot:CCA20942.1 AlNc14C107G6271 [Albugo laibachii Nc14]